MGYNFREQTYSQEGIINQIEYDIWLEGVKKRLMPLLTDIYDLASFGYTHSIENHLQATWISNKSSDLVIYNKDNNKFFFIPNRDEEKAKEFLFHDLIIFLKNKEERANLN